MGGGGGDTLGKLFPGYKDKIWSRVPSKWRIFLIQRWNNTYSSSWYSLSVVSNKRMQFFHQYVADPLKPSYEFRNPLVDFKRQIARGTLVEGTDAYIANAASQNRLSNIFQPYTDEELKSRSQHKHFSLKWLLLATGAFCVFESCRQQRPVAWCLEKQPPHSPHYPFWFKGFSHSHDIPSVRRGYEVYRKVCATCHSMEQIHFRHLVNEVLPEKRVKQIAASYDITDGPNDQGEMFTRPGILTDAFPSPYPNEEAARYANEGAVPPDLSLITAARHAGPDYMMAMLLGYRDPPEGIVLQPGLYYNTFFPGGTIAMPPPLEDDLIEYEDGTPATVSQMAKDVVNFCTWATEPVHDERKLLALKATSASFVGMICATIWYRFYWTVYATRRIDFGKIKYM